MEQNSGFLGPQALWSPLGTSSSRSINLVGPFSGPGHCWLPLVFALMSTLQGCNLAQFHLSARLSLASNWPITQPGPFFPPDVSRNSCLMKLPFATCESNPVEQSTWYWNVRVPAMLVTSWTFSAWSPNAVKVSGLFPQLDGYKRFIKHLSDQGGNHFVPWIPECANFFTGGSTSAGAMPGLALAAWSVCLADPHSNDVTCAACGTLPGGFQSNNKAELFAVVLASTAAPCGHIYTDSSYVVQGFRKLQTNSGLG